MSTICSDCYNGCTEIVSDKCVKYTGVDVPILGIKKGDSLSYVEQALITFLTSTLDGEGIKIDLIGINICTLVQSYLPTCGDLTIVDISKALIQTACNLQAQIDAIDITLEQLNADYIIGCLTGVISSDNTHTIVQAVINKLCQIEVDLAALVLDLTTNYINVNEIDAYIESYIETSGQNTLISNRMVPYSIVPYYGPLTNFNGTGAGTGDWTKIYLCNGANPGVPDLRGRTLVGTTTGMFGGALSEIVDFSIPGSGNPNYTLGSVFGANKITLDPTQIPSHTHSATALSTISPDPHTHTGIVIGPYAGTLSEGGFDGGSNTWRNSPFTTSSTSLSCATTVSIGVTGQGAGHPNIQPSIGVYFIIYIP
jgi:microcystin-dependent protein